LTNAPSSKKEKVYYKIHLLNGVLAATPPRGLLCRSLRAYLIVQDELKHMRAELAKINKNKGRGRAGKTMKTYNRGWWLLMKRETYATLIGLEVLTPLRGRRDLTPIRVAASDPASPHQ